MLVVSICSSFQFTPGKSSTPRRYAIVFVSPDGDEIKNKKQLDKYLKSHPGGPPASEFNWGTGISSLITFCLFVHIWNAFLPMKYPVNSSDAMLQIHLWEVCLNSLLIG